MDIILREYVKGLGYKNDVVSVKPGFGRNFLIPQGLGVLATGTNLKIRNEDVRQVQHKLEKLKKDAQEIVNKIGDATIEISTKVGESGKIFGAITALQVADALKDKKGVEVDRKKISFKTDVKEVGTYAVVIDLHKEVKHEFSISVVAE